MLGKPPLILIFMRRHERTPLTINTGWRFCVIILRGEFGALVVELTRVTILDDFPLVITIRHFFSHKMSVLVFLVSENLNILNCVASALRNWKLQTTVCGKRSQTNDNTDVWFLVVEYVSRWVSLSLHSSKPECSVSQQPIASLLFHV